MVPQRQRALRQYHDSEWGVPAWDDRTQFEFLILEGAQAGLSWSTILNKREGYRAAFAGFDPERIARFGKRDVARLMQDPGIVRNRLKIAAAVGTRRRISIFRRRTLQGSHSTSGHSSAASPFRTAMRAEAGACDESRVRRAIERSEEARLQFRRHDDHLRAHAGDGAGQRPHRRLLSPSRVQVPRTQIDGVASDSLSVTRRRATRRARAPLAPGRAADAAPHTPPASLHPAATADWR